jgi:phage terminase large subunit GpA-like protein
VLKFLNAEKDYLSTQSQDALKTTTNTDQGEPYVPRGAENNRRAEDLQSLALPLPERLVPEDVRCLFATCDVQKNRWEVQIHGVKEGNPYDLVVIDRFPIVKSNRVDDAGDRLWVKPAEHVEDWDLLLTEVMDRRYDLADGSGTMGIAMTTCDSGGREGVTTNAYLFYGKLKKLGRADRFLLCKGDSSPNAPRVHISFPDSKRKDRRANARGEVPVLMMNSNLIKDALNGMLPIIEETLAPTDEPKITNGRISFPDWLDAKFFEELTVETIGKRGWENKLGRRNESWDLLYYCIALCVHRRIEHVSWADPPIWLSTWDGNPFVQLNTQAGPVADESKKQYGLAHLGDALG